MFSRWHDERLSVGRQNLGGAVAEVLGVGHRFRFGDQSHDRLGVARTDQKPPIGPVQAEAVDCPGGGVRRSLCVSCPGASFPAPSSAWPGCTGSVGVTTLTGGPAAPEEEEAPPSW